MQQKKPQEALVNVQEALELFGAWNGEKSIGVADALKTLGEIRVIERDYDEALRLFKKSDKYYRRSGGNDHAEAPVIVQSMLETYLKQEDYAAAVRLMQKNELLMRRDFAEYDMSLEGLKELAGQQTD